MSTALEAASLIMIPTSYSDGLLASVKPNDGAGDFTFSRGSNISATRVNADGYIEKGYENLLLQSNTFSDAVWTKFQSSITGGQEGYDGTNDAWILEKTAASGRLIQYNVSASGVVALSIYAKAGTLNWMRLLDPTTNQGSAYFNLSNGEVYKDFGIDAKIESAGNGWYRCSVVGSLSSGQFWLLPADGDGDTSGTSGNILIQDAMVNQGLAAYPYVETTTAPVAGGILEDMPRIDHSSGKPSLLLEPQRTNKLTYSEYFGAFTQIDVSLDFGYLAPDGTNSAYKVTDNGTNSHLVNLSVTDEDDSRSIYARTTSGTGQVHLLGQSSNANCLFTITEEWQRFEVSSVGSVATHFYAVDFRAPETTLSEVLIWGAQCEDATYPTSYIPTYGVSQTRLKDVCNDAGDVSTFNSTEGVLYAELSFADDNSFKFISLNSGISTNRVSFYSSSPSTISVNVRNTSGNQFNGNFSINSTINHKIAVKYKENDFALWIDGQERLIDSSGTTFPPSTLTQLNYDDGNGNSPFNGIVKQMIVFPTALSDDECIALTTI